MYPHPYWTVWPWGRSHSEGYYKVLTARRKTSKVARLMIAVEAVLRTVGAVLRVVSSEEANGMTRSETI